MHVQSYLTSYSSHPVKYKLAIVEIWRKHAVFGMLTIEGRLLLSKCHAKWIEDAQRVGLTGWRERAQMFKALGVL